MLAPSSIIQLSMSLSANTLSDTDKAKAVCQCILRMITNLRRVSVWRIPQEGDSALCLAMNMPGLAGVVPALNLSPGPHADFFEQLEHHQVVISEKSPHHPVIRLLNTHCECAPNAPTVIFFRLDQDNKMRGFLCCESGAPATDWSDSDRLVLARIASTTALFL